MQKLTFLTTAFVLTLAAFILRNQPGLFCSRSASAACNAESVSCTSGCCEGVKYGAVKVSSCTYYISTKYCQEIMGTFDAPCNFGNCTGSKNTQHCQLNSTSSGCELVDQYDLIVCCAAAPAPTNTPAATAVPQQTQNFTVQAYTASSPNAGNFANVAVSLNWNNDSPYSGYTDATGKISVSRSDSNGTSLSMTVTVPTTLTVSGFAYNLSGVASKTGCTDPGGVTNLSSGVYKTSSISGNQTICLPIAYVRVPSIQGYPFSAKAYYLNSVGAITPLDGQTVTFNWTHGGTTVTDSPVTNANGIANSSRSYLNDVSTNLAVSMPASITLAGHRLFNFGSFTNTADCLEPYDWTGWTKSGSTAASASYLVGNAGCVGFLYAEAPETFTYTLATIVKDGQNVNYRWAGQPITVVWDRTAAADITQNLTTDSNGLATATKSLATSDGTTLRITFPTSLTVTANRTASFAGFNVFNTQCISASVPSDWASWVKNAAAVTSPSYSQAQTGCIEADYTEDPQVFTVIAHAFYNNLLTNAEVSLPGVAVRAQMLYGDGSKSGTLTSYTSSSPITMTRPGYPFRSNQMVVTYPTSYVYNGTFYEFVRFIIGGGGTVSDDWAVPFTPTNVAKSNPVLFYSATQYITAKYKQVPLPAITFTPLNPPRFWWRARDLGTDKNLPIITGTVLNAYPPGTGLYASISYITLNYKTPTDKTYGSYTIPVVASAINAATGYVDGTFALDEDTIRSIERARSPFTVISSCWIFPERLCFGTTVGTNPCLIAGASREDEAIGNWTITGDFTRVDVGGVTRVAPSTYYSYSVQWDITIQP